MSGSELSSSGARLAAARELVGVEVLVLDRDPAVRRGVEELLGGGRLHVTCVEEPAQAYALVEARFFSVMLVDLDTPTPGAGVAAVAELRRRSPTSMLIALAPRRSYDDAVAAVRAGAIDLILKVPASVAYLEERVRDAAGRSVGQREVDSALGDVRTVLEEFLQRFMEAERRALDLADKAAGRDASRLAALDELRLLVVDEDAGLYEGLHAAVPPGYVVELATSGGEGLDRASSGRYHYALVADGLTDLPSSTVARTLRAQHPEAVVLAYRGPAEDGRLDLVEAGGTRPYLAPFREVGELVARLEELAEAWRVKARERRYATAFRERHYDFLRRYAELREKLERAMREGPG